MGTRQAQLSFLKDLILRSDREESRGLLDRISQAAQQEQLSRRWTLWIASVIASLYAVVALVTEGWAWVWRQSEHPLAVALLWIVGIALFSLLLVGGCWLWHRSALKRLVSDSQRFLAGWLAIRNNPVDSSPSGTPQWLCRARRAGGVCHRHTYWSRRNGHSRRSPRFRRRN